MSEPVETIGKPGMATLRRAVCQTPPERKAPLTLASAMIGPRHALGQILSTLKISKPKTYEQKVGSLLGEPAVSLTEIQEARWMSGCYTYNNPEKPNHTAVTDAQKILYWRKVAAGRSAKSAPK